MEEYWATLTWMLAGDDKNNYDALRYGDVLEFFRLLKIHEKNQVRKMKAIKKQHHGQGKTRSRK
jgi:hypothetical protein